MGVSDFTHSPKGTWMLEAEKPPQEDSDAHLEVNAATKLQYGRHFSLAVGGVHGRLVLVLTECKDKGPDQLRQQ